MKVDEFISIEKASADSGTKIDHMEKVCIKKGIIVFDCINDLGEKSRCIKLSDYVAVFGW